ncbi:hypothetical protein [Halorubellus sp. JP-L1]|uniref:hypothetical protein n=1 Tax=Halorubellus sp. JP-L1 TaxID=2715753 RepID=UPI001F04D8A2|nr:hypothetical protein [Halorubellus sp. JP-L1]
MLTATLLFVAGAAHWAYANLGAFRSVASAVASAGTDTAALRDALVARRGVPTLYEFVRGTELVDPMLPTLQWYGALAGSVGVVVLAFGLYRAVWTTHPFKWVTMNETLGVGAVAAAAAAVYGGPLLAGAVVLPFVFAVIVRHTRAAYKFKPTYGYVLGVSVPLATLGAEYVRPSPPLAVDLAAVVVPVLTVLVLLFSAFVRPKLFG